MPGRTIATPEIATPTAVENELVVDEHQAPNDGPGNNKKRLFLPLALWLCAIGLGVVATLLFLNQDEPITTEDVDTAIGETLSTTTIAPDRGPAIYGTVIQSVVFIQVGNTDAETGSIGTGTVINADGTVMTSNHVVDSGEPILLTFADGTQSAATIIDSQPENDIATLAPTTLPAVLVPATIGGAVPIGAKVFAIGNPLGLGGSFSAGVVSGLGRQLPLEDGGQLEDLIQFDAAVNPGSSGGPLVNENGQVIGIVTALVNPTGSDFFSGIGFAVPMEVAGGGAGGPQQ